MENNVTTTNFKPFPEYIAFEALQEAGILSSENASEMWNKEDSEIHKFWEIFATKMSKEGYGLFSQNTSERYI